MSTWIIEQFHSGVKPIFAPQQRLPVDKQRPCTLSSLSILDSLVGPDFYVGTAAVGSVRLLAEFVKLHIGICGFRHCLIPAIT